MGDTDGSACAAEASRVARDINNIGRSTSKRRRRQTTDEEVEPIYNFMTVATTLEDSQPDGGDGGDGGNNGGTGIITMCYPLLFAATLLVLLML